MINCYCYTSQSDKIPTEKEVWINRSGISFALSIITMIGAAVFYGACLIHNPVIPWSQTEYFISIIGVSLIFAVGSVACRCIADRKNNPESQ
jgi:hypothetical protein